MIQARFSTLTAGCPTLAIATAAQDATPPPAATPPACAVEEHGEGTPVLLIPGSISPGSAWNETVAHLRDSHQLQVSTLAGFVVLDAPHRLLVGFLADGRVAAEAATEEH